MKHYMQELFPSAKTERPTTCTNALEGGNLTIDNVYARNASPSVLAFAFHAGSSRAAHGGDVQPVNDLLCAAQNPGKDLDIAFAFVATRDKIDLNWVDLDPVKFDERGLVKPEGSRGINPGKEEAGTMKKQASSIIAVAWSWMKIKAPDMHDDDDLQPM